MTNYYLAQTPVGDDSNDGLTPETPKATFTAVESAGLGAGDALFIIGDYEIGAGDNGGFIDITANYSINGLGARPTITGNNAVRVLRNSASVSAGDIPTYTNLIVDAGGSTYGIELPGDTAGTAPSINVLRGIKAFGAATANIFAGLRENRFEGAELTISGNTFFGVASSSSDGGLDADTDFAARDVTLDNVVLTNATGAAVQFQRGPSATNKVVATVERVRGNVQPHPSGNDVINMEGVDQPVVRDCDIQIDHASVTTVNGIQIQGLSTYNSEGAVVVNNTMRFNSPAGYAMALGKDGEAYARTGTFAANHITGQYYAANTPHGISLREGSTGEALGNVVRTMFASILVSITTSSRVVGNLIYDPSGSGIYVKGAKGAALEDNLIANNTVVCSAEALQRNLGLLAVTNQLLEDTTFAVFESNIVIVQDPAANFARGGYIASITDANQNCEFRRNLYIIPDTVDLSTATYWEDDGTPATFATWLARADVIGDQVLPLTQSEIDALVNYYKAQAEPGVMAGTRIGIIEPIVEQIVQ